VSYFRSFIPVCAELFATRHNLCGMKGLTLPSDSGWEALPHPLFFFAQYRIEPYR
jgi:hypothetical protein